MMAFFLPNKTKGFTLIELLVVIAILSLLSTVVLASLKSARIKASDTAIKAEVMEFRKIMLLEYQDSGSYQKLSRTWVPWNTCTFLYANGGSSYSAKAVQICESIVEKSSAVSSNVGFGCCQFYTLVSGGDYTKYFSIMAWLPGSKKWFCVGSSGAVSEVASYNLQPGCWNNP